MIKYLLKNNFQKKDMIIQKFMIYKVNKMMKINFNYPRFANNLYIIINYNLYNKIINKILMNNN